MRTITTFLFLILLINSLFPQARMVINNNAYVTMDGGVFMVLENANANAITVAGSGANIISEDEDNKIRWNIGTTTGNYAIPYTTSTLVKIPFSMNITSAGVGSGRFDFSTYETATDNNTPYPSMVTNMSSIPAGGGDGSLYVIDRFWIVDANNYTTKPNVSMIFGYNPAVNEMVGSNTIVEANLLAQRFNDGIGDWQGYYLFGTNDAGNDRVTGANVAAADFFAAWTLVDYSTPLPVTLTKFDANCDRNTITIEWTTSAELNNDFFVVEKSNDGIVYFDLMTIQGAGTSNVTNSYSVVDDYGNRSGYYRLKQVDYNGTTTYYEPKYVVCSNSSFEVNQFSLQQNNFDFNITVTDKENVDIALYDVRGRIIAYKKMELQPGDNSIKLDKFSISKGMYMLSVKGDVNNYTTKLMKQ